MKKYIVLILSILSETSTGPSLILSAISGATIVEGIHQVRKK